jgi:hypothetical protein
VGRLLGKALQRLRIEPARIDRDLLLCAATEQAEYGLVQRLAHRIPQRKVDGADGRHAAALAPERVGHAIHALPQIFDVESALADQQRPQVIVYHRLGGEG